MLFYLVLMKILVIFWLQFGQGLQAIPRWLWCREKKLLKRKQRTIRNDNNTKIKTHHSKEIHLRNTKLSRSQLKENHHEILSKQSMENYLKDTEWIRRKFSSWKPKVKTYSTNLILKLSKECPKHAFYRLQHETLFLLIKKHETLF